MYLCIYYDAIFKYKNPRKNSLSNNVYVRTKTIDKIILAVANVV